MVVLLRQAVSPALSCAVAELGFQKGRIPLRQGSYDLRLAESGELCEHVHVCAQKFG